MGTHDSDEALVLQIKAGELRAFETLHQRYYPKIYKLALIKTGSVEDAKDIAGETFCRALAHLAGFRFQGCSSLYPWLHRIATNLVIDWSRVHSPSRNISLDAETGEGVRGFLETLRDNSPSPQKLVERKETQTLVRAAIAKLPDDQADAIAYRFLGELSIREIAAVMERSEGAVKSLIHRALISLRQELVESAKKSRQTWSQTSTAKYKESAQNDAGGTIEIHRRSP